MPCPDCSDNADYERVELVWPGKGKPVERVSLPFQTIERVNDVRRSRSAQAELVSATTRHSGIEQNHDSQDMPRHSGLDAESAGQASQHRHSGLEQDQDSPDAHRHSRVGGNPQGEDDEDDTRPSRAREKLAVTSRERERELKRFEHKC